MMQTRTEFMESRDDIRRFELDGWAVRQIVVASASAKLGYLVVFERPQERASQL